MAIHVLEPDFERHVDREVFERAVDDVGRHARAFFELDDADGEGGLVGERGVVADAVDREGVERAEAARALRGADVIARYGKLAGYKPKEAASPVQAASIIPTQPAPVAPAQAAPAMAEDVEEEAEAAPAAPPRPIAPIQVSADRALPTLDEVYKSLSASEKARVNRLPPAQRADYLEQIRKRRF